MVKFFSLGRRIFRLDIERWRAMRRKGRYLRYYLRPLRDDRNILARTVDFYGPLLAAVLVTWAIAAGYSGNSSRTFVIAAPLTAVEIYAAFRLRRTLRQNAALHDRMWRDGRQCRERIKNIGGLEKLEELVVEILEKAEGFSDVHAIRELAENPNATGEGISVRALYLGVPVAVGCLAGDVGDEPVSAEKVLKFKEETSSLGHRAGILVAAGLYSGEARRAAREGRKRITLVDLYKLVELARETGHGIFTAAPGDRAPAAASRAVMFHKLVRIALSREKAGSYFISAGVMLGVFYLTGVAGVYTVGYMAFAGVNLALSIYCLLSDRESDILGPARLK